MLCDHAGLNAITEATYLNFTLCQKYSTFSNRLNEILSVCFTEIELFNVDKYIHKHRSLIFSVEISHLLYYWVTQIILVI